MSRPLNPSQEAVADCRDKLCVIAGAGSGKTHTLVEALTRRLEESLEAESAAPSLDVTGILALTFTEKAAAELRQRLAENFQRRRREAAEPGAAEFWRLQAARLDRADIGTIHSYALTLVRENAVSLGLPADPAIDDDPGLLHRDLEQIVTDRLDREDPDLLALLRYFPARSFIDLLADCAGRLSSWGLTELTADLEPGPADFPARLADFRSSCVETLARLESGELGLGPDKKYFANIRDSLATLVNLLSPPPEILLEDPDLLLARAGALLSRSGNWYVKSAQAAKKELAEALEKLREQRGRAMAVPLKKHFLKLLRGLPDDLTRRKRARQAINFDDILILARRLLATRPAVRQREIKRRRLILIDEFQDTNRLQADLLAYLLLPADDERVFPENYPIWRQTDWAAAGPRFSAYGDLKQSIYRFRGAEVEVMASLAETFSAGSGQVLPLNYNYRSQEALIGFFNSLFSRHLGSGFGRLDGQAPVRPNLYPGPHVVQLRSSGPRPAGGAVQAEAQAELLRRYLAYICGPDSPVRVGGPGPEGRRPGPGDVAVLFRRFTWAGIFKDKLSEAGWQCRLAVGDNPFDYVENKGLVAAFDYLSGLDRDLSLAACLRSPLGPVSDAALLTLAWPGPAARPRPLSRWFEGQEPWPEGLDPEDQNALEEMRRLLQSLAPLLGRVPAVEILERLVEERRLIPLAGLEPDGEDRARAITRLLALSRSLGRRRTEEPAGAAEELRNIRLNWNERRSADLSEPGREAVTLMTVHASKGLEFPVLIIAEADSRPGGVSPPVLISPGGRLALRFKNSAGQTIKTPDYLELEEENKSRELRENGRLFYVAATRAQDHLALLGWPDPKKEAARAQKAESGQAEAPPEAPSSIWLEALLDCPEAARLSQLMEYDLEKEEEAGPGTCPAEAETAAGGPEDLPRLLQAMSLKSQSLAATALGRLLADPAAFYRESHLGLDLDFQWDGQEPFFRARSKPLGRSAEKRPAEGLPLSTLAPNEAGTLFHAVMEELNPLAPALGELLPRQARKLGLKPAREELEFLSFKLEDFLAGPLGRLWRAGREAGQPDYREWPFWLELPELDGSFSLTLNGIIDLFFIGPDGSGQIVDYKLARLHPGPELAAYENQLRLYAQAIVSGGFEGPLRAALYFAGVEKSQIHEVKLHFPEPMEPLWPGLRKNLSILKNTRPLRPKFPGAPNIVYFSLTSSV